MKDFSDKIIEKKKRIRWIDIAKGLTIILVIWGHTSVNQFWRGVIFSWHMPLFFVLSTLTYRFPTDITELWHGIKKDAKHILLPFLVVFFIRVFCSIFSELQRMSGFQFIRSSLFQLVFSAGVSIDCGSFQAPEVGIAWFLVALFIGRVLYAAVTIAFERKQVPFVCLLMTVIAVGNSIMAFSFDIAMAIQSFFYAGHWLQKYGYKEAGVRKKVVLVAGIIWLLTFYITFPNVNEQTYLELAIRRYGLFPLGFICAIAGTLVVCELSKCIDRIPILTGIIGFIGANSLYLFVIHCLDGLEPVERLWNVGNDLYVIGVRRIGIDIILMLLFWLIKVLWKKSIQSKMSDNEKRGE